MSRHTNRVLGANIAMAAGLLAILCLSPCCYGQQPPQNTEKPLAAFCYGKVVASNGQAIADARVTLAQTFTRISDPRFIPLLASSRTKSVTVDAGAFKFALDVEDAEWWPGLGEFLLIAQAPGYATSVTSCPTDRLLVDHPFEIQLRKCDATRLRLSTAEGQPVSGAEIRVSRVDGIRVPDSIAEIASVQADAQGTVTLTEFDDQNLQEIIVRGETIGIQRLPVVAASNDLQAQLRPMGRIQGTLSLTDSRDQQAMQGIRIWLTSQNTDAYVQDGASVMSWCQARVDANGKFTCDNLVFGTVGYLLPASDAFPFLPDKNSGMNLPMFLPSDRPFQLDLSFEPARKVRFRFIGRQSEPIPNLGVYATFDRTIHRTDESGSVHFWFAKDATLDGQLFAWDPFDRYVQPPFGFHPVRMELNEDGQPEPIAVPEAYSVTGRVLDAEGNAVAGATVTGSFGQERFTTNRSTLSDRSGNYSLRGIPASTTVTVSARKENWMTDIAEPLQVQSGAGQANLLVQPQETARLTGRVVDARGSAIADAKVSFARGIIRIKEGYRSEEIFGQPLDGKDAKATTDASGQFASQPLVNFGDRFEIKIEAPGYLPHQSHFLSGKVRPVKNGRVNLGVFRLLDQPPPIVSEITVVGQDNQPIAGAELVVVGPTLGRVKSVTDKAGIAKLQFPDAPGWLAVRADAHPLHLKFHEAFSDSQRIALEPSSISERSSLVPNLTREESELRQLTRVLLSEIPQPAESESSVYRQMRYFSALATADFESFKHAVMRPDSEYQNAGQFLMMKAKQIFQADPLEALESLRKHSQSANMNASVLSGMALESTDPEIREELLGEAVLELGNCSGNDRLVAAGYVALAFAITGQLETAESIVQESLQGNAELQEVLEKGTRKHERAVARVFAPKVAWIDPDGAFKLIKLLADQREVPRLNSEALVYLSMKDPELAFRLVNEMKVDLGAGIDALFRFGGSALLRDRSHQAWLAQLADRLEPSASKTKLLVASARHLPPGDPRAKMFAKASQAWQQAQVDFWYHWSDPGKGVLEALAGFHDLKRDELDELIFASLVAGPTTFDSYNPLCVLANSTRLVSLRDPRLSEAMLGEVFKHHQWMRVNGNLTLDRNNVIGAIAWTRPEWAVEMLQKIEGDLAMDDDVIPLQLRAAVIEEVQALIDGRCRGNSIVP